LSTKDFYITS